MSERLEPCKICGNEQVVELNDVSRFAGVSACSECGVLRIATASNLKRENKADEITLSLHDKTVYDVAAKQLQQGAKWIEIGAHIDRAGDIIEKLKARFPEADIHLNKQEYG